MKSINPNAVLRGETNLKPGDAFICEVERNEGWVAIRYTPNARPKAVGGWKHFTFIKYGNYETVTEAVMSV
jgi:hypothetical protein